MRRNHIFLILSILFSNSALATDTCEAIYKDIYNSFLNRQDSSVLLNHLKEMDNNHCNVSDARLYSKTVLFYDTKFAYENIVQKLKKYPSDIEVITEDLFQAKSRVTQEATKLLTVAELAVLNKQMEDLKKIMESYLSITDFKRVMERLSIKLSAFQKELMENKRKTQILEGSVQDLRNTIASNSESLQNQIDKIMTKVEGEEHKNNQLGLDIVELRDFFNALSNEQSQTRTDLSDFAAKLNLTQVQLKEILTIINTHKLNFEEIRGLLTKYVSNSRKMESDLLNLKTMNYITAASTLVAGTLFSFLMNKYNRRIFPRPHRRRHMPGDNRIATVVESAVNAIDAAGSSSLNANTNAFVPAAQSSKVHELLKYSCGAVISAMGTIVAFTIAGKILESSSNFLGSFPFSSDDGEDSQTESQART